ncbi:RrF2 family transcriptional regulator [Flavisolibacter tropicus]|uniref:Rrf2 family transcriptional regulator n=1 Tax=Flavisolibacter tropicus TaxID=1492898 RepID=A0A172TW53_9BACT|nr:Rrf2 family transcriptional regulator [Flavisolibacter tropicus]ANE50977.1 Rrf2 family transcriptional regulator [Flavisolibacter tropicus]
MLSNKAQYAFRALTHLVDKFDEGPVLISEIAEKKRIPLKFLENILLGLRKAGILESKKGKGGGYFIKDHPSKTSIAAVIRIVDGPIAMLPCVSLYFYEKCKYCDEGNCGLHGIMEKVRDATLAILENKTLMDLKSGQEIL